MRRDPGPARPAPSDPHRTVIAPRGASTAYTASITTTCIASGPLFRCRIVRRVQEALLGCCPPHGRVINSYGQDRSANREPRTDSWLNAAWTRLRTTAVPFGEQAWTHAPALVQMCSVERGRCARAVRRPGRTRIRWVTLLAWLAGVSTSILRDSWDEGADDSGVLARPRGGGVAVAGQQPGCPGGPPGLDAWHGKRSSGRAHPCCGGVAREGQIAGGERPPARCQWAGKRGQGERPGRARAAGCRPRAVDAGWSAAALIELGHWPGIR